MRAVAGLVVAAACLVLLSACSGSSDKGATPNTIGPHSSLPELKGFRCEDPTGDIGGDVKSAGTLSQPAGIDIVVAEAKVDGNDLAVTYTMAGDVSTAPMPLVDMLQGAVTAPTFSFELRARPGGDTPGSPWELTLITFQEQGQEVPRTLSTPVTVEGNTVSYRVALSDIPTIATLQWSFGASSTGADGNILIDDCNSLTSGTTDTIGEAPGVSLAPHGPVDPNDTNP